MLVNPSKDIFLVLNIAPIEFFLFIRPIFYFTPLPHKTILKILAANRIQILQFQEATWEKWE